VEELSLNKFFFERKKVDVNARIDSGKLRDENSHSCAIVLSMFYGTFQSRDEKHSIFTLRHFELVFVFKSRIEGWKRKIFKVSLEIRF
jgi:hypothetical protein